MTMHSLCYCKRIVACVIMLLFLEHAKPKGRGEVRKTGPAAEPVPPCMLLSVMKYSMYVCYMPLLFSLIHSPSFLCTASPSRPGGHTEGMLSWERLLSSTLGPLSTDREPEEVSKKALQITRRVREKLTGKGVMATCASIRVSWPPVPP